MVGGRSASQAVITLLILVRRGGLTYLERLLPRGVLAGVAGSSMDIGGGDMI